MTALHSRVFQKPEEVYPGVAPSRRHDGHALRIDDISSRCEWTHQCKHHKSSCNQRQCRLEPKLGLMVSCHALVPLCLFCLSPMLIHLVEHYDSRSHPLMKPIPFQHCALGCSGILSRSREVSSRGPSSSSTSHHTLDDGRIGRGVGSRVGITYDLWCLDG